MPTLIAYQPLGGDELFVYYAWPRKGQSTVWIGRGANPGLHIPHDPTVSKQHARVTLEGGRHLLTDNESKNGVDVLLNGARVPLECQLNDQGQYPLDDGNYFWIGDTQVQFVEQEYPRAANDPHAEARRQAMLRNAQTYPRVPRAQLGNTHTTGPKEPGTDG